MARAVFTGRQHLQTTCGCERGSSILQRIGECARVEEEDVVEDYKEIGEMERVLAVGLIRRGNMIMFYI